MMVRARSLAAGILAIGLSVTAVGPARAADHDRSRLVDGIVAKSDPKLLEVVVTRRSGDGRPSFATVKVPTIAKAKEVVDSLLGKPGVRAVEMNRRVKALANDPLYPEQWALQSRHLNLSAIQSMTKRDTARVTVAVVDTGIQGNHPDLSKHLATGYTHLTTCSLLSCHLQSGTTSATTSNDDCGHGTHVAGIISAQLNNKIGVAGLAQRTLVRSVKVLDASCEGDSDDVAAGIVWAADHAQVINLSLGSPGPSDAEAEAVDYAINTKHRVVVAAAGNCDPSCTAKSYPAAYPGVLGVAATSWNRNRASFSSYGYWVDVSAPGDKIASTVPTNQYAYMSGTSMATPYVAAEAALGIQHCHWSAKTTASKIMKTATHPSRKDVKTGYGIIRPTVLLRC